MAETRTAVLEGPRDLRIHSLAVPTVGPDDALLKVEMVGVCGTDYSVYTAKLSAPYPVILGHEILGHIAEIGDGAAARYGVRVGDRVTVEGSVPCWSCVTCQSGSYRFCKSKRSYGSQSTKEPPGLWGAMAEYMYVAPGSIVHRASDSLPARTAITAGLVANGIAWLRNWGNVSLGDTVLIQGAGPQGLAAVVIARECGAGKVIVTGLSRDDARLKLALTLGADVAIIADQESVAERVAECTNGRLADVVLEVTGAPSAIEQSVTLVRPLGTLVLGGLTGDNVETRVPIDHVVWNGIRLQGVRTKGAAEVTRGMEFLASRGQRYPLDQIVSHVYDLAQAETAIRAVGEHVERDFIKAAIVP